MALFIVLSAVVVTYFSTLYPSEKYNSYFEYGFYWNFLTYVWLTFYFYLFVSSVIGVLSGLLFGLFWSLVKISAVKLAILAHLISLLVVIYAYYYYHISSNSILFIYIVPSYVFAFIASVLLIKIKSSDAISLQNKASSNV